MSVTKKHIRRQLVASLSQMVDSGIAELGEHEMAGILRDLLAELEVSGGGRTCTFSGDAGQPTLTLRYDAATALEREIELLTEVCGLMVDVDSTPPMMELLDVVIEGEGCGDCITLSGRAVHQSPEGLAVELTPPDDGQKKGLEKLADQMKTWSEDVAQSGLHKSLASLGADAAAPSETPQPEISQPQPQPQPEAVSHPHTVGGAPSTGVHIEPPREGLVGHPDTVDRRWNLKNTEMVTPLLQATSLDGYGLLEFISPQNTRQLILHFGDLIDFRSDPPVATQRLVEELRSSDEVDQEQLAAAEEQARRKEISIQTALIDSRTISHRQLAKATRRRLLSQLHQLWSGQFEEAHLYSLEHRPIPEIRCSLSVMEQIVGHLRNRFRQLSNEGRERREKQFSGRQIRGRRDVAFDYDEFGLNTKEERFLQALFDDFRTVFELNRISTLHRRDLIDLLFMLEELGCLEYRQKQTKSSEERRVEKFVDQIRRSDNYFELFGLHWSTFDEEVEEKHRELQGWLDVPEEIEAGLSVDIDEAREQLAAAYRVLSSKTKRDAHRKKHIDSYARKNARQMYEDQIEALQMREDKRDLHEVLKRYLELRPRDKGAREMLAALEHMASREGK